MFCFTFVFWKNINATRLTIMIFAKQQQTFKARQEVKDFNEGP